MDLTEEELRLLKELKAAGKVGRTISAGIGGDVGGGKLPVVALVTV